MLNAPPLYLFVVLYLTWQDQPFPLRVGNPLFFYCSVFGLSYWSLLFFCLIALVGFFGFFPPFDTVMITWIFLAVDVVFYLVDCKSIFGTWVKLHCQASCFMAWWFSRVVISWSIWMLQEVHKWESLSSRWSGQGHKLGNDIYFTAIWSQSYIKYIPWSGFFYNVILFSCRYIPYA